VFPKPSTLGLVQLFTEGILFLKPAVRKRLFEGLEIISSPCPTP
jgi:hypothetical protein